MKNGNDWEELNCWENERKQQEITNYGLNFSNINLEQEKKNVKKIVNFVFIFKLATIIIIIVLIIIMVGILATYFGNITFMMSNTSVKKAMLQKYNLDVTIFGKVKDPNKDYMLFNINSNNSENIEFAAIKKNGKLIDDYIARRHQYYFKLWNKLNQNQNKIKIHETIENELLSYGMYVEDVENQTYFEDAVKEVINFIRFCGNNFMEEWDIYICKNNKRMYLFKNINTNLKDSELIAELKDKYFN